MDGRMRRSRRRFAAAMSSIMEKYNFPFDDDMIVSMKSLTYDTPDGQKVWGEESSCEIIDRSYQITVQRQENIETQRQQASDSENEEYEAYESFETNLGGDSQLDTDHKRNAELTSLKRHLENIHIKENIPPIWPSGTPVKNKHRVEVDLLLEDGASSVPRELTVARTKARDDLQWLPLQELDNDTLSGHPHVVLRKQALSTNEHSALLCHQLSNSDDPSLNNGTVVPRNQFLWGNNETGFSSFLEMYESADEHCSWNNITIADLYPKMVKTLSRLLHKASSSSLTKWNKRGFWHPKKTKLNTSKERMRNIRSLKLKSSWTMTVDNQKKHKLAITDMRSSSPFDDDEHQTECSVNNVTRVVSSISCDTDSMEVDSSGIVEDHSYAEKVGQNDVETSIFPSVSSEETFLVRSPICSRLSSGWVERSHSFEESSSTIDIADSGGVFNLTTEDKSGEINTVAVKTAPCLSLSSNSSTNSYLQNNKPSPVKTSNTLLGNHEIKMFNKAISLQRSYSLSSLPVNRSSMKVRQKCDDAFEKMYKELCSPRLQKSFKFTNMRASPQKSAESRTSGFNGISSRFHQKCNSTFDSIYQQLCSEGFPKSPTFLRAANLKRKYEGLPMSETVNALVNSPVRTLPAISKVKRTATFFNEDSQCSPIKRLKNISENSFRICKKLPSWKKTDMTFTLYSPDVNYWTSCMDSGFSASSKPNFLAAPSTNMAESGIANVDENIPEFLQSCVCLGGPPKRTIECLNYDDGQTRSKNIHVEELVCKEYEGSSSEGDAREFHIFKQKDNLVGSKVPFHSRKEHCLNGVFMNQKQFSPNLLNLATPKLHFEFRGSDFRNMQKIQKKERALTALFHEQNLAPVALNPTHHSYTLPPEN